MMSSFLVILIISAIISLVAALYLRKNGYPFWRTLIAFFIAITAVLALAHNLIRPYL